MLIVKAAAMGFATLVLGACTPPWPEADQYTRGRAFQAAKTNCYITLADRECYGEPIPGQRYRRAGLRPTEPR